MSLLEGLSQAVIPDLEGAACFDMPYADAIFFPNSQLSNAFREARLICGLCPVRDGCLELALANEDTAARFGMFGGKTPQERGRIQRDRDGIDWRGEKYNVPCKTCSRPMRHISVPVAERPTTIAYGADGECTVCQRERESGGLFIWDGSPCVSCNRAMRKSNEKAADHPGTLQYAARGKCVTCYRSGKPPQNLAAPHRWDGSPCVDCGRAMRSDKTLLAEAPGTIQYGARGRCHKCDNRKKGIQKKVIRDGTPCVGCGITMRSSRWTLAERPGTVPHRGQGKCGSCLRKSDPARRTSKARTYHKWDGSPCTVCKRQMRRSDVRPEEQPGTVQYGGKGKCFMCRSRQRRGAPVSRERRNKNQETSK